MPSLSLSLCPPPASLSLTKLAPQQPTPAILCSAVLIKHVLLSLSPSVNLFLLLFFSLSFALHQSLSLPVHLSLTALQAFQTKSHSCSIIVAVLLKPVSLSVCPINVPCALPCRRSLARMARSRPVSGSGPCGRLRGLSAGQVGVCRARGEVMESVRRAAEMVIEEVRVPSCDFANTESALTHSKRWLTACRRLNLM